MAQPRRVKRQNGAHAIAWNQCAVDFGPGDGPTRAAMRRSLRAQQQRKPAKAVASRETSARDELGEWTMPHAVSLAAPFTTVCGLPYMKGVEVPSIWDRGQQIVSFEGLDYRMQCYGCLHQIWSDPEA